MNRNHYIPTYWTWNKMWFTCPAINFWWTIVHSHNNWCGKPKSNNDKRYVPSFLILSIFGNENIKGNDIVSCGDLYWRTCSWFSLFFKIRARLQTDKGQSPWYPFALTVPLIVVDPPKFQKHMCNLIILLSFSK